MLYINDFNLKEKFNKKYLLIGLAIFGVILIISIVITAFLLNNNKNKYTTLISGDEKFSIQIPNSINYRTNTSQNNDFTIDLFSEQDEMFMYATKIDKIREFNLTEIATDDKTSYFKDKENIRDDSGILETKVADCDAVKYSLVYYDSQYKKDFYCQVLWIETSETIYVFNFEVSNENSDKYKEIFNNMINSLQFRL